MPAMHMSTKDFVSAQDVYEAWRAWFYGSMTECFNSAFVNVSMGEGGFEWQPKQACSCSGTQLLAGCLECSCSAAAALQLLRSSPSCSFSLLLQIFASRIWVGNRGGHWHRRRSEISGVEDLEEGGHSLREGRREGEREKRGSTVGMQTKTVFVPIHKNHWLEAKI